MILGTLKVEQYLKSVKGLVTGAVITDAKDRQYHQRYQFKDNGKNILVSREDGNGDEIVIAKEIEVDEPLIAFFGLYSGDGAKGTDDPKEEGRILPSISFSQKERYLVRFAVDQFKRIFPHNVSLVFSLGEDSAYFMAGEGQARLGAYYRKTTGKDTPALKKLEEVRSKLNEKDAQYLQEVRHDVEASNEESLAFYYQHKSAMEEILAEEKCQELATVGIEPSENIRVSASLRRPFKKGARTPGGSSRSDEIYVGGLNGIGELFLKMMHEIEDSLLQNSNLSSSGLVEWIDKPESVGDVLDLEKFFTDSPFGVINGKRPKKLESKGNLIIGQWPQSSEIQIKRELKIDPLWCYIAGLYLAEGTTSKEMLFRMFSQSPKQFALGFTSSEGVSIELVLRALQKLFNKEDCLQAWKVKVGNQYFPELVVTGQKQGVAMLRGGESGDGKLRTMEISIAIKDWALNVADAPLAGKKSILRNEYSDRYSHVEPTGAGVARIDFWASSTLCRWYFPLLMYTIFGGLIDDPAKRFYA